MHNYAKSLSSTFTCLGKPEVFVFFRALFWVNLQKIDVLGTEEFACLSLIFADFNKIKNFSKSIENNLTIFLYFCKINVDNKI